MYTHIPHTYSTHKHHTHTCRYTCAHTHTYTPYRHIYISISRNQPLLNITCPSSWTGPDQQLLSPLSLSTSPKQSPYFPFCVPMNHAQHSSQQHHLKTGQSASPLRTVKAFSMIWNKDTGLHNDLKVPSHPSLSPSMSQVALSL